MLGRDLFKVDSYADISSERFKSLVLFYGPLIGNDALYVYEFLTVKGSSYSFEEIVKLLNSLSISIEKFEECIKKLNEYNLVTTLLKNENGNRFIFKLNNPLTSIEFINNSIFVRNFILHTSGEYYQSLIGGIKDVSKHDGFKDVTLKLDLNELKAWNSNNESILKTKPKSNDYNFNTFFDVDKFLSDISLNLLPMKYRTEENMKELATLADLYNISYDKMRTYIPQVSKTDSDKFDLKMLRYLCENANQEFKVIEDGEYKVPCELFLMNKQNGKEVTRNDKEIIYHLAHDYHLLPSVINVLLEHCLNSCNNALIEKYIYAVASDLHRNDIDTANKAIERLTNINSKKKSINKESKPIYDDTNNPKVDFSILDELYNK